MIDGGREESARIGSFDIFFFFLFSREGRNEVVIFVAMDAGVNILDTIGENKSSNEILFVRLDCLIIVKRVS